MTAERIPISRSPRRIRTAISPRLAMSTLRMRRLGMVSVITGTGMLSGSRLPPLHHLDGLEQDAGVAVAESAQGDQPQAEDGVDGHGGDQQQDVEGIAEVRDAEEAAHEDDLHQGGSEDRQLDVALPALDAVQGLGADAV